MLPMAPAAPAGSDAPRSERSIFSNGMTNTTAVRLAAIMGFLAVALGAFGAHGLENILKANETAEIWKTAVFYHFLHAVVLFVLAQRQPMRSGPWWSFFIGIVIFSGSLYLLAVTNARKLGMITPVGGVSFLVGWLWLVLSRRVTGGDGGSRIDRT